MASRREKLDGMLQANPQDQMLRYMLALELEKEGENQLSLELLTSLIQDTVPYVPAFLMAGQQLARINRVDEARATYSAGITEAQKQSNSHAAGEMAGFLATLS